MKTDPASIRVRVLSILPYLASLCALLVPVIAYTYGYSLTTTLEAGAGFLILLGLTWFLIARSQRTYIRAQATPILWAVPVGIGAGLLWVIEIGINNFLAPPLPARDIIDNIFWAVIALIILAIAFFSPYMGNRTLDGVTAGAWVGLTSGLIACAAALAVIVFGMGLLLKDPLNLAEWASVASRPAIPNMAQYFAFETFAGAFLHLIVLGVGMGVLLGIVGGMFGKGFKSVWLKQKNGLGRK